MSEPTYRVDLSYVPGNPESVSWRAEVVRLADEMTMAIRHHESHEEAFAAAVRWVYETSNSPHHPSSVYLSEDGDLLDHHEVQR